MRVIAGEYKGRRLATVTTRGIRPTSDRVREALFSILGDRIAGARVLDLFAGTGALGLEALSRGAVHAIFMEMSTSACDLIRENIRRCHAEEKTRILCRDISAPLSPDNIAPHRFSLVFMDPPYGTALLEKALTAPELPRMLTPDGMVIAEHSIREPLPENITGLDIKDQRKYGKTLISFLTPLPGGEAHSNEEG